MRELWAVEEGRRRILLALVVPAVLALAGTVALSVLTISSTSALSDNVRLTQDLVDGNVRTLSQVQRELLRLDGALSSAESDPDRIALARSLAAQRIQEATLDYQGRTLGNAGLLTRSRALATLWHDGLDVEVQAVIDDPSTLTPARRKTLSQDVRALEVRYNTLVSDAEHVRKSDAAKANAATAHLVRDTRWLLGGLVFTLLALVGLVAGMVQVLYTARRSQVRQTARLKAARAQLQRHSMAVQTTDNLVIVTDAEARIEWVNPAFTRHTGYELAEVEGRSPGELLTGPDTDATTVAFMRERIRARAPFTSEVLNYDRHGRPYWISLEVRPILEDDVVTGFVAVQTDITKRRATEDALRAAKETAEETADAKQRFLASMSHEIRTPLNAVLGLTELLLDTELAAEQRQYVATAHQSGRHLLAIVNDILDFSALESGKVETESTSADVRAVLEDVCAMLQPTADRAGLRLTWEADPQVPARVCTDVVRVRQVLINLVGNGLKFTEAGGVRMVATYRSDGTGPDADGLLGGRLVVEVHDTGTGIPENRLERIFSPFAQGDASTTRTHGGTGLGLAICTRIASRLGGALDVRSAVGVGSVFTISVPVRACTRGAAADPAADPVLRADEGARSDGPGPVVLLAEDDPVNRMVALHMLRRLGVEADVATDGVEAVAATAARDYDIVLMDVNMPNLDGVGATRALRERGGRQPHVVALTANAADGDREKLLAAGMDAYLSKPYTLEDLERTLAAPRAAVV
ncbi:response regulator [Phycicoccus sp. HDW14]|uniref:hybrid sensor histidine kinase/response regulator n=1 Tax=Phycicoccus sp. HDW14 TaxID=2714941 RepID=UPI00140E321E|nr:PAS domain-containing hybrid sensor histidine kinase/response regulator [Phycicoccus sp. HDW14]QIM20899.1 response regulator [Phycicoccus sp. HDW14]